MTDAMPTAPGPTELPKLDAEQLFSRVWVLFLTRFWWAIPLATVPSFARIAWEDVSVGFANPVLFRLPLLELDVLLQDLIALTIANAVGGLVIGLIAVVIYRTQARQDGGIVAALPFAGRRIGPLMLFGIVWGFLVLLGSYLLLIPGLYLSALWIALFPAIAVEGMGFRAFGRSVSLTRGRRWSIVGILLGSFIVLGAVMFPILGLAGVASIYSADGLEAIETTAAVVEGTFVALGAICVGAIYARLRELAEGGRPETLEEVFG